MTDRHTRNKRKGCELNLPTFLEALAHTVRLLRTSCQVSIFSCVHHDLRPLVDGSLQAHVLGVSLQLWDVLHMQCGSLQSEHVVIRVIIVF